MKYLVIVESPSKSHTIEKYLGKEYKVLSSKGHIRDLATTGKYGLGVDLENNFKPNYIIKKDKGYSKLVRELQKEAKDADHIILATDPDREGEAISWHLKEVLKLKENDYSRVVFHEITEPAIKEAFSHLIKIDEDLVHSQESRRILDRIIGFRLSKLMQYKTEGKSAGRVQSVVLKLIVDREEEILKFVPTEYYDIDVDFKDFKAKLKKYKGKSCEEIPTAREADLILSNLSNAYNINKVDTKKKNIQSKLPFTTSTLTQSASSIFGYPSSKTMSIAQKLYEGVNIGSETVGLISYMRTDSVRLSDEFVKSAKGYIKSEYGQEYVGNVKTSKKKDNVQDAHEAIRPTSINRTPDSIKKYLKPEEYKLYSLIYSRTLASLMASSVREETTVELENNGYTFTANGHIYIFDGYLKVYKDYEEAKDAALPDFANYNSKVIVSDKAAKHQHFKEAPPRYTEAKLIEMMEKSGIGRPSTYASTIKTLKDRKYVDFRDKKFYPTEVGTNVTKKLQEFFSSIINIDYTAEMEKELDEVASGNILWYNILDRFYKDFEPLLNTAFKEMEKDAPVTTGEKCPLCNHDMVIRNGKYGKFEACSNYPECKYIKKVEKVIVEICSCPKCNGMIVEKKTRRGKVFYGCNNYPKCDVALWDKPTGEVCDKCGNLMVEGKESVKCSVCK